MKKFVLHKWFGEDLSNESLTQFIEDKAYALDDFESTEDYRCGFSPIHKKLNNLFIEGNGFVKTTFKMATRTINKKLLSDLLRKKLQDNAEKGLNVNPADVEFAINSKLRASSDFKFSEFDVLFDTKNNIIYSSATYKVFEDKFLPFLKRQFPELKIRTFKTKQDAQLMAGFFIHPDQMPEGINPVSPVKVEKSDGTIVTFDYAALNQQREFKAIVEERDFLVHEVAIQIHNQNLMYCFKINKNFLPASIDIIGTETDSQMESSAELSDASSEGGAKELSKEEVLFDMIYTNTIILYDAVGKIAEFLFDYKEMEDQAQKIKSK